jgi:hypothetical protein
MRRNRSQIQILNNYSRSILWVPIASPENGYAISHVAASSTVNNSLLLRQICR